MDFIATRRPGAAIRVIDDIFDRVEILAEQPRLGRVFPGSQDEAIRQMTFDKYRVIYHVDLLREIVTVLTVQHTRESPVELDDVVSSEE